jgi:lipopolysaccharide/colanic/teichoic acid biosynthesis glycosyltransferase
MEAHPLPQKHARDRVVAEPLWQAVLRRGADLTIAVAAVVVLAPILVAVAVAVRIDSPGPAFFRQRRVGHGRREFTLFKFRSMRTGADPSGHRDYVTALINGNDDPPDNGAGEQDKSLYKLVVDDRITRVGRFIRRYSLDELPQLFNVVLGDMALVGPRPAIPYEVCEYPGWYLQRFAVKPGLTGLWQVSGRSERTYEEMVRLDIDYAKGRTVGLDLKILAKTPWVVISRKGAE